MLVLFGTHGKPGATTTAFLIANFWARRAGVEKCILIEADPTGGVLDGQLHLNLENGLAPMMLAGENIRLEDYTESLPFGAEGKVHVLCAPHAVRSAWDTVSVFCSSASALLEKMDKSIPIVVDAGRLFHNSPALNLLTSSARAALVIGEGDISALPSAVYFKEATDRAGIGAGLISVGTPIWSPEDYKETLNLNLLSWVGEHPEGYVELQEAMSPPNKNRLRPFYGRAEAMADDLYTFTYQDFWEAAAQPQEENTIQEEATT